MPGKRNATAPRKATEAGAVMLSEEELDEARGAGALIGTAVEPSAVTVRGWDPSAKKAIIGKAE